MSYQHITLKERYVIYHLRLMRLSFREIGRRLDRHHTTISREVKRNGPRIGAYWDQSANHWATERKHKARHTRKYSQKALVKYVYSQLRQDWSPATIAARIKIDFPRNLTMRISAEGIYRWIYRDAREGGSLYLHCLRHHKKRRRQGRYGTGRGLIPGRVSIDARPASVDRRSRFGHWEADSVEGAKGSGGIATHVERKSRLLLAGKLTDKRADTFNQTTYRLFAQIPGKWKKSLTVDNGKEFSLFKGIEKETGMTVYFADPYSPWQRGTNENTNGLIRHYFPKGINWKTVSDQMLATAVDKLNNRPRKCLGYRTPLEVFTKNLGGALGT